MQAPKLDSGALQNAIKRVGKAHDSIKEQIAQHAAAAADERARAHDALHAMNVMQHKT